MAVTPPYSIIDSIARLREQDGAAWGNAAASVGQSIGNGVAQAGQNSREKTAAATLRQNQLSDQDRKDVADRYHDVMTAWDKAHSGHMVVNNGGTPATGARPMTPGTPPPGAGILQPASTVPPLTGQSSQPPAPMPLAGAPPQPAPSTEGLNNMAEFFKAHGVVPPNGSEKIWAKPNIDTKTEGAETVASTKAAGQKDAAASLASSRERVAKIGAAQRAQSSETAAEAKKTVAGLGKQGKEAVAQAQKDIQAMKNGEMTEEDYNKAKEKSPFYYALAESTGVIEPPGSSKSKPAAAPEKSDVDDFLKGL